MIGAITGIINFNKNKIGDDLIVKMLDVLGNSEFGREIEYISDYAHFGCASFSSGSISSKKIMFNQSKCVVADAFISNKVELVERLNFEKDESYDLDLQLIYASFLKWGSNCTQFLEGNFAFVVYDQRLNQLFCFVSESNPRPFFYFFNDNVFIFSTEPKSLLAIKSFEWNYPFFVNQFEKISSEKGESPFLEIKKLSEGTFIAVGNSSLEETTQNRIRSQPLNLSADCYAEKFLEICEEILKGNFPEDEPIGILLTYTRKSLLLLYILRKVFPSKRIVCCTYLHPPGIDKRSDRLRKKFNNLKNSLNFELVEVFNEELPKEYHEELGNYKMWSIDSYLINPIGTDHEVLYPKFKKKGIDKVLISSFNVPISKESAVKRVKSRKGIYTCFGLLKLKESSKEVFKLLAIKVLPSFLSERYFLDRSYPEVQPFFTILTKDEFIRKNKIRRGKIDYMRAPKNNLFFKTKSEFERRYGVTLFDFYADRRMIDFIESIPVENFIDTKSKPSIEKAIYQFLKIPEEFLEFEVHSWPIDWPNRRQAIRNATFEEFSLIQTSDPVWNILDRDKTTRFFEKLKKEKSGVVYHNNFRKLADVILMNKFLKLDYSELNKKYSNNSLKSD